MAKIPPENINELDFNEIRDNFLSFVKNNSEFKNYDFEASGLNFLVDLLSYNTQYTGFYLNQVASEMFLDTAQKRKNAVSHAKQMGYTANSKKAAIADITFRLTNTQNLSGAITIPRYTLFYGKNSTGEVYPFMSWNTVTLHQSNQFTADLNLVQGQFVKQQITINNLLLEKKYKLESPDVDLDNLDIYIKKDRFAKREQYKQVYDITVLNKESKVFYIEQDYDQKYQIIFGDGVLGREAENNEIIEAEYIITTGSKGNGCVSFDIADRSMLPTTYVIVTEQFSSQGTEEENIETIRHNSRRLFLSQNRSVTEKDTEIQILRYFPFIDSLAVWGGEKNTPPMYGTVYCAVKPKNRGLLTIDEKEFIISRLEQLNVITIVPKIVDPEYVYLKLDARVIYNSVHLNMSQLEVIDLVKNKTILYAKENLLKFNRSFQLANLTNEINDLNEYFMGTTVKIRVYQKRDIRIGVGKYYSIDFNGRIDKETLTTTKFVYNDAKGNPISNCYLKESGEKVEEETELSRYATKAVRKSEKYNVDIAFDLNGTTKILHKGIGKVDYESGILELEGFSPSFVQNNSTEMIFEFGTSEYLLVPKKDQIFSITIDDVIVDPRPFVDRLATSSSLEKASLFDS